MESTRKRRIVGIFDIISGIFSGFYALTVASLSFLGNRATPSRVLTPESLIATATFLAVLGILALVGGICAWRGKMWRLALAGSLSASICFAPLGIPASILLLLSREVSKGTRLLIFILFGLLWLLIIGIFVLALVLMFAGGL